MPNLSEPSGKAGGRKSGFQDRELECAECGRKFVFTEGEQRFFKEKGLECEPRRCSSCRNQRKNRTQDVREHRQGQPSNRAKVYRMGGCISGKIFSQMSSRPGQRRPGNHYGSQPNKSNSNGRRPEHRNSRAQSSNQHSIVCARCSRQAYVPFKPRNKAVVYCPECYRMQRRQKNNSR